MERPGEQQFGITNNLTQRTKEHERSGWYLLDCIGPSDGNLVQKTERILKRWLKKQIGTVPGTKENWYMNDLDIQSLKELKEKCELEIDIF